MGLYHVQGGNDHLESIGDDSLQIICLGKRIVAFHLLFTVLIRVTSSLNPPTADFIIFFQNSSRDKVNFGVIISED